MAKIVAMVAQVEHTAQDSLLTKKIKLRARRCYFPFNKYETYSKLVYER